MLRPRRPFLVCVAACVFTLAPAGVVPTASAEDASVGDCVRFELARIEPDMAYAIANSCEIAVSCTLSWRLVCGEDRGGKVSDVRRRLRVPKATSSEVAISTASCGDDEWRIEDVAWACDK